MKVCPKCGGDYIVSCDEMGDAETHARRMIGLGPWRSPQRFAYVKQDPITCDKHWHCEDCAHTWDKAHGQTS